MRAALVFLLFVAGLAGAAPLGRGSRDFAPEEVAQSGGFGNVEYDGRVVFVRIRYDSGFGANAWRSRGSRGEPPWAHDYPTSDTHLMRILKELTLTNARFDGSNVYKLDDPELFDYPIAYMSEPGYWTMTEAEVAGLRQYLRKGGFIIFDDFRENDWYNLEEQMKRVMPDLRWVELDPAALVFNSFFEIRNFNFGQYGKETYFGLFEDNDPQKRLLAVAGHNQDLGEFWEFSDTGMMPVDLSNEAYKFGVNYFIHALIH